SRQIADRRIEFSEIEMNVAEVEERERIIGIQRMLRQDDSAIALEFLSPRLRVAIAEMIDDDRCPRDVSASHLERRENLFVQAAFPTYIGQIPEEPDLIDDDARIAG